MMRRINQRLRYQVCKAILQGDAEARGKLVTLYEGVGQTTMAYALQIASEQGLRNHARIIVEAMENLRCKS